MENKIENTLEYLKYRKSFCEYLPVKLFLETELEMEDILNLKARDVKGKTVINGRYMRAKLSVEIDEYLKFIEEDSYLFEKENGEKLTPEKISEVLHEAYNKIGYQGEFPIEDFTGRMIA